MIEFQRLHKSYAVAGRAVSALQPLDLTIEAGEVFGIIGHSGAGKSTLIRMINRLEEPSGGRLLIAGEDVTALDADGLRALRRRIGMIFQHFNLLSSRTVAGNVAFPLELAGTPAAEIDARVAELLRTVGLEAHAAKYPAQLSGGQKQRIGLARALYGKPALVVLDEPNSNLDDAGEAALVAAIDAAADALPRGMNAGPCLERIRVAIYRDDLPADEAGRSLLSMWTGGSRNLGRVKVTSGPGFDEAIRRGVEALLRSELDPAWVAPPLNDRVF